MTTGLRRMGAKIEEHDDGMTVYQSKLQGSLVEGCGDHRTVMALTVAGMLAEGTTTITDGAAVNKTFPDFVSCLQKLGAAVTTDKPEPHIILIGFKHVGKTLIGRRLAKVLEKNFIDLDKQVEKTYYQQTSEKLTCREIMYALGETDYRLLESQTLALVLQTSPSVISLGGGSSLSHFNQAIIKPHLLLHVTAPRGIVFERIMVEGRPAFFNINEDPYECFSRLWDERNDIYEQLTTRTIDNSNSVDKAVREALTHCHKQDCSGYA
jgi:shikimate kinase